MNFKKALIVYRKELLELLRDRRTLFTTIILPVIMYPLLFMGFSAIMSRQSSILEKRGATVAFQDSLQTRNEATLAVRDSIFSGLQRLDYVSALPSPPHVEQLYKDKDVNAIVTVSDSLGNVGPAKYRIKVRYDASEEAGRLLFGKIEKSLTATAKNEVAARLTKLKLDKQLIDPFRIDPMDSSTSEKKMGSVLGMILPYIMILTLIAGAATVAADLVAGEKERRTLETLLVSSATRSEIVLGKYLSIFTVAMVNVLINLFSISFSLRFLLAQSGMGTQGLQMPVKAFLILLLALVPLASLFAAVLLSISTFSRNMKEARTYEQPIMMISMLLGMISFVPSVQINNLLALVPVVNIALLFKAVMINEFTLAQLLITVGSTLFLDVLAIWATVKLFNTEAVLFRKEDDSSLKITRANKRSFFNSFYGLVYFALALAALYYIGGKWQSKNLIYGLEQTQVFIILLPVLLVLRLLKLKPKEILRYNLPRWQEAALIPFIAIPAAIVVAILGQLVNLIFPYPPEYIAAMEKLFNQDVSLAMSFFVIAVLPGLCEETLFRGFLIRFFEGHSARNAVIISALLFALFHLDPFRFVPAFLLGLLLGYLTVRSGSIVNSMLSHMINNGLALFIVTFAGKHWLKPLLSGKDSFHWWVGVIALAVFVVAIGIFHKITAPREVKQCAE